MYILATFGGLLTHGITKYNYKIQMTPFDQQQQSVLLLHSCTDGVICPMKAISPKLLGVNRKHQKLAEFLIINIFLQVFTLARYLKSHLNLKLVVNVVDTAQTGVFGLTSITNQKILLLL